MKLIVYRGVLATATGLLVGLIATENAIDSVRRVHLTGPHDCQPTCTQEYVFPSTFYRLVPRTNTPFPG